ncbi:MAG: tRNA (guanosine(46)-N7)-methyltransferase TrmB, partial [Gammaproteobacteria bacterium]|nr:tRNA (guanosine(46)-N7)-methyltransferase TrmB [Gammaproteobacteria bacterium]
MQTMQSDPAHKVFKRRIKTFVKREGRFTEAQQRAFTNHWPAYGVDYKDEQLDLAKLFERTAPVILEIGFGNGDSLGQMA